MAVNVLINVTRYILYFQFYSVNVDFFCLCFHNNTLGYVAKINWRFYDIIVLWYYPNITQGECRNITLNQSRYGPRARPCNLPRYTLTRPRLFDFLEIALNTQGINNEPLFIAAVLVMPQYLKLYHSFKWFISSNGHLFFLLLLAI